MQHQRKPEWLKIKLPDSNKYKGINRLLKEHGLHTICTSGKCPNMGECWNKGTATFMILGDICTRGCKFCNVTTGKPNQPDKNEPVKLARAIAALKLKHAVITSVDRDDLPDKGSGHWNETIVAIKQKKPEITMECLIPDFDASQEFLDKVIDANPEVVSHNLETVERLTPLIRSKAQYKRSLDVLYYLSKKNMVTKTGIMVGLGETNNEVEQTMSDALKAGCKIFTIGQYLQPTTKNAPVERYVKPEEFEAFKQTGLRMGLKYVESAPLVRSSYHAEQHIGNR